MAEPDFTITAVRIKQMAPHFIVLGWQTASAGHGEITFGYHETDGLVLADDERMGVEFVRKACMFFVDEVLAGREPEMRLIATDRLALKRIFVGSFNTAVDRYYGLVDWFQRRGTA
jgi:hypothetical protein